MISDEMLELHGNNFVKHNMRLLFKITFEQYITNPEYHFLGTYLSRGLKKYINDVFSNQEEN